MGDQVHEAVRNVYELPGREKARREKYEEKNRGKACYALASLYTIQLGTPKLTG